MIAHFFIDRPIFASVLSIVITLTGGIALFFLPVAQYPPITPPGVQVSIQYPGASAQVVADTVAAPVEQQVNGVPGMLYMSSQSGNDGSYTLTVTFDLGVNLNTALVMVQNRVALAMPQLPVEVQRQGITIRKKTPDILQVINFYSPDGRYDAIYLSNYATINVKDEVLRVDGVSDVTYLGQRDYSMRVWLDPQKLASCNLSAPDLVAAVRSQNVEAPAGQVGQPPTAPGQSLQQPLHTLGRLVEPEQFEDIIVKTGQISPAPPYLAPAGRSPGGLLVRSTTAPGTSLIGTTPAAGGDTSGNNTTGGSTPSDTTSASSSDAAPSDTTGGTPAVPSGGTTGGGPAPAAGTTTAGGTTGGVTGGAGVTAGGAPPGLSVSGLGAAGVTGQVGPHQAVSGPQGQATDIVRLRDVARVELGAQNYNQACTFDGHPSVGLAVFQLPGTNALDVADRVRQKMEELKSRFPEGVDYRIAYDITPFVRESIDDVVRTLFEAVALVALVVLVFLQNWRAAVIPLIAVPVAIVGTFAVMAALGFSLNNISLFGLVLAIGIVVDDAIVVVENVERWLAEGYSPRDAARKAMDEVTGPVIAVALVLCAVFVPCAFISGITGQFFRQFAVTIAVSTVFSAFNSLTLSPALAAILLKPHGTRRDPLTRLLDVSLGWFFRLFNKGFAAGTTAYTWAVGRLLRGSVLVLFVYGGLLLLTWWVFHRAPTGFVPQQDQGRLIVNIQLPDSTSLEVTRAAVARIESITDADPGVAHTVTIAGLSFVQQSNSSSYASMFVVLKPFGERRDAHLSADAVAARLRRQFAAKVKGAAVTVFGAPPIPGLSVASGFKLIVEDRAGLGLPALQQQTDRLVGRLRHDRGLIGVFTQFHSNAPQLWMDVDRTKVESEGVSIADLNQTLQVYLGSLYVNSFNAFGRTWQVTLQAEGDYRTQVPYLNLIEVRNRWGEMVPLATLVSFRDVNGPVAVTRYNLYTAAPILGALGPGVSTGDAITAIEGHARETLPRSMSTEWTELMFMQIRAGNTAMYVFALAVMFVFLALAALYESWSLPLAVILVVPLCLLCSVGGVLLTHMEVDIFVQIGLVVLVGLACKNAILIVEFAQQVHRGGLPRYEATLEACRLRLRPILMTSLAFILGVVPLVIATGAGAEMRRSLGTAVFAGMIGVTAFGVFLTPVFFYVIAWFGETRPLTSARTQWVGSSAVGGLLGGLVGYLLARVGVGRLPWGAVAGAALGLVVALIVPVVRRTIRRPPARPDTPHGGHQP